MDTSTRLAQFASWSANPQGVRWMRVVGLGLLALALVACKGSAGIPGGLELPGIDTMQLSLQISETAPDGKLRVEVQARSAQGIFQLSTRIEFDPLAVKPLSIERGGLVGQQAVFFTLDNQAGFIPLAFTYHQGDSLPAGEGTIAEIVFEVLDSSRPASLRFNSNDEYLIARDAGGSNLPVQLVVVE